MLLNLARKPQQYFLRKSPGAAAVRRCWRVSAVWCGSGWQSSGVAARRGAPGSIVVCKRTGGGVVLEDHLVPEEVLQSPEGSCCEPWFRAEVADVVMQFSTEE